MSHNTKGVWLQPQFSQCVVETWREVAQNELPDPQKAERNWKDEA